MRLIRLTEQYITEIINGKLGLRGPQLDSCSLTLGSFDGLHRGHRKLLDATRESRRRLDLAESTIFTFRQHPRQLLDTNIDPFLLTTWREKLSLLEDLECRVIVAADFCPALAGLDYRTFVEKFLVGYLGMRHLVVGHDAHLGSNRKGTAVSLAALGQDLGFGFQALDPVREGDLIISSSAIRKAVSAGKMEEATRMLGRPFALWGEVVPGDRRGREIGYPTANVKPLDTLKLLPEPGVYAVRVQVPGDVVSEGCTGSLLQVTESLPEVDSNGELLGSSAGVWTIFGGMLNFGKVPTFHGDGLPEPRIEANIFGFDGDLRGRNIKVEWISRLRGEVRFGGADQLVEQLEKDADQARRILGLPE
jgi:riboflavin kinase / FMN adenylyltransferase